MATLDRDGVAIHYEVHGRGPVILLSHGYSATCRMWDGQIAALQDRYQFIVWDMRGHGQSDYPDDPAAYSEAATVEEWRPFWTRAGTSAPSSAGSRLVATCRLRFIVRIRR